MSSKEEIAIAKEKFTEWVDAFGVYQTMPDDQLKVTEEIKPFVWTEFMNDNESFVSPGYTEANQDLRMPVVGYFLSKVPFPQDNAADHLVMVSMLLDCSDCEGMGEDEDGEECETCDGDMGTYVEFNFDAE
jgi:hypothetical protein